ncbi:MAG: OmpA family protein [Fluviicola sp.]
MKKIGIVIAWCCSSIVFGQETFLERQAERTKEKIKQRAENRVEQGIDKTLDKTEEEIESGIKDGKKQKKEKDSQSETTVSSEGKSETNQERGAASNKKSDSKGTDNPEFKVYSKFDFVPGEKVLAIDDFSTTAIGDFPLNWNTNASAEVVSVSGESSRYLKLSKQGIYLMDDIHLVQENFTMEFDVIASEDYSENLSGLKWYLVRKQEQPLSFDQLFSSETQMGIDVHPTNSGGTTGIWVFDEQGSSVLTNSAPLPAATKNKFHISIWRQKTRIRIYVNENKVFDIPRALFQGVDYQLLFANYTFEGELYLSNIRYAVGSPDTRNKLVRDGKLITRGILFDSNSDHIKAESAGTLKEIADVLKETPEIKVLIVGHTDSDGDNAANVELSKKRALAVKKVLVESYGISESSLSTDGKGENEPTDSNTTPVGKANNRRVEFLKL